MVVLGLVVLGALVAGNAVWIHAYRFGLPFTIDEAGYLQRAFADGQALRGGHLHELLRQWSTPDFVGPLLPLVGGVLGALTGATPWSVLDAQQIFYLLLVIGTFFMARQIMSAGGATLAAFIVACTPGVLVSSHFFLLGEPCAALFTMTLAAQLRARSFDRLLPALAWGALLGLTSLTRTMVLGLIPALLLTAAIVVAATGVSRRRLMHLGLSVLLAVAVAVTWYWTSWPAVYRYLTNYGYGRQEYLYTGGVTEPLSRRWVLRLGNIINQDLYFPIALTLIVAVLAVTASAIFRRSNTHLSGGSRVRQLRRVAEHPLASLLAVLLLSFGALSTTDNSGSYFELVLVPQIVVAVIAGTGKLRTRPRVAVVTACVGAALVSAVDQFGLVPRLSEASSVSVAGTSFVAFNDANSDFVGPRLRELNYGGSYWSNCGGATVSCFYGRIDNINERYLDRWLTANGEVTHFLYHYGPSHGYSPVVFFAYQGPLLNTNTVALDAQLEHRSLPIGALIPSPLRDGLSWRTQLENPLYGQPNFVIAGEPGSEHLSRESSSKLLARVATQLKADGFRVVHTITIPDASPVQIWWKDR